MSAVVGDGTDWYAKGANMKVPDNIVSVILPPHSPKFFRRNR